MNKRPSIRWATFRDLEIIKTIIEKSSVTLTAEALGVTQPAISRAIASIEEKSGKVFFIRDKGKLLPTADALFIYEEINNIFLSLQRIDENNWSNRSKKTIRVMVTPSMAYSFMAPLTAQYLKEKTNLKISLSVVNSVDMVNHLREGHGDLAIGNIDINNSLVEVSVQPLQKSKVVCIMSRNHELASKENVTVADFNYRNIIMYTQRNILASKILKKMSDAEVEINVIADVSDSMLALNFARENAGICFAPIFPLISQIDESLVVKDIGLELYDEMAIFSLARSQNPHWSEFIEYVQTRIVELHPTLL